MPGKIASWDWISANLTTDFARLKTSSNYLLMDFVKLAIEYVRYINKIVFY